MTGKILFLIFNHKLTATQKADAERTLQVSRFVTLPGPLQQWWSNIPPDAELDTKALQQIGRWLLEQAAAGDYVLLQGDFGATFYLVDFCLQKGLVPLYATTMRRTSESIDERGRVEKISRFQHVAFRKYRRYDE